MKFNEIIKSIIKHSGASVDKVNLEDFMERINHSFVFAPQNYWLGVTIMKTPLDLAILQQIIFDKRPDTIIECGTAWGGSAYYMACMMDLTGIDGKVITIDCEVNKSLPYHKTDLVNVNGKVATIDIEANQKVIHPRIKYIHSDCLTAKIPRHGERTMVILDCDHSADHVYKELEKFSSMVSVGQYIIVEDTDAPDKSNGPAAAVKRFLGKNKNFIADKSREKYGISSNLGGYLLKVS